MSAISNIIVSTPAEELEKILSPFIREQFPSFVRNDYGKLILFVKAYYEWLEQKGNASFVTMNLEDAGDVDSNLEEFYSHFRSTYLDGFPQSLATNADGDSVNKTTLLKKIREFYGNKGTESAYRFLFNVLYNSDLEIYTPIQDVLRVSDGQWVEPTSIKTTSKNGKSLFGAKGGNVYQYSNGVLSASAFVDSVVQYVFDGLPITEFFIKDISGNFVPSIPVTIVKGDSEWSESPYSVLGEFFVEDSGAGYRIGDNVTLFDATGKGFSAKVKQTGLAGGVKKIEILNSGLNYFASNEGASADFLLLSVFSDKGEQTAKVYGKISAITRYPGYFSGNRGKVSSNKKIQDGHYYQDFSYELKSSVSLEVYFDTLKSLIHPAGNRMFGSVLIKEFLNSTQYKVSTEATFYEDPVLGKYSPYKTTTAVNLRDNGVTLAGYWLGATGDLYPLGYNPYIGSTAQVGVNGRTTSAGTIFVGSSLGYTWCYVPEDGITSHDPIGSPLGSTSSWYSGNESNWTPAKMRGLKLWLRPETIGVCGSVVNGASVDVWRDSSPSLNHALPPTWDRFNYTVPVFGQTADLNASSGWATSDQFGAGPYTNFAVSHGHMAPDGSMTATRLIRTAGTSADGVAYRKLVSFTNGRRYRFSVMMKLGPSFPLMGITLGTVYSPRVYASTGVPAYGSNYSNARITQTEWKMVDVYFTATYTGNASVRVFEHGHVDSYGTGTGVNNYVDVFVWNPTIEDITNTGYGITIDKLRPQLVSASIAGPTGVCFNGGVLYAPTTNCNGRSLSNWIQFGSTFGTGLTAERILTGQHLYLKNSLTVDADAEIFVVFRPTVEGYDRGLGIMSSDGGLTAYKTDDTVLYHRSYNPVDRNPSLATSTYYKILPDGKLLYPSLTPTGLVGFRPSGSRVDSDRTTIAHDPHISGVCFGIAVGNWNRDETLRIRSFLNGNKSTNRSFNIGRRIASVGYPNTENYFITNGLVLWLDAGNAQSYGGSGSIWYDISGKNNHATLINNPVHSSSGGGYFALNGLDQYVSTNISPTTTMTFMLIYKLDNPAPGSPAALGGSIPGGGWGPLWRQDSVGWRERVFDNELLLIPSSGTYYYISGPRSTYDVQCFAYSYGGTEARTYNNGSSVSTIQMDSEVTPSPLNVSNYQFGQIAGGSTLTRVKMNLHMVAAYNRVLSPVEIFQTFNSIRERYGL